MRGPLKKVGVGVMIVGSLNRERSLVLNVANNIQTALHAAPIPALTLHVPTKAYTSDSLSNNNKTIGWLKQLFKHLVFKGGN